ncbi:unnamed protein product [Prorocentrum cordatum]|uniref:Uncharacterized protein n=1 Tax=Prorocentrum cordatum TaxID=2364126 RepID=A0ABN9R7R7_9DINO|nr:unnamed protein product [Polarella glacialis]
MTRRCPESLILENARKGFVGHGGLVACGFALMFFIGTTRVAPSTPSRERETYQYPWPRGPIPRAATPWTRRAFFADAPNGTYLSMPPRIYWMAHGIRTVRAWEWMRSPLVILDPSGKETSAPPQRLIPLTSYQPETCLHPYDCHHLVSMPISRTSSVSQREPSRYRKLGLSILGIGISKFEAGQHLQACPRRARRPRWRRRGARLQLQRRPAGRVGGRAADARRCRGPSLLSSAWRGVANSSGSYSNLDSELLKAEQDDGPGTYRVISAGPRLKALPVSKDYDRTSAKVGEVVVQQEVKVLQVAPELNDGRRRARIADPAGWITLLATKKNVRFAVKQPDFLAVKG